MSDTETIRVIRDSAKQTENYVVFSGKKWENGVPIIIVNVYVRKDCTYPQSMKVTLETGT